MANHMTRACERPAIALRKSVSPLIECSSPSPGGARASCEIVDATLELATNAQPTRPDPSERNDRETGSDEFERDVQLRPCHFRVGREVQRQEGSNDQEDDALRPRARTAAGRRSFGEIFVVTRVHTRTQCNVWTSVPGGALVTRASRVPSELRRVPPNGGCARDASTRYACAIAASKRGRLRRTTLAIRGYVFLGVMWLGSRNHLVR